MGCVSGKHDFTDLRPNVFQVMNVDERGNGVNPGKLEITELDLVLHQRGKASIQWPLKTLRRYGFDADHFSFESGRRGPTGPGIYAFQCARAEQLFNLLQSRILTRNDDATPSDPPGNYLEPRRVGRVSQNGTARLSSVGSAGGSGGPMSPLSATAPPLPCEPPVVPPLPRPSCTYANDLVIAQDERNNNKTDPPEDHTYLNSAALDGQETQTGPAEEPALDDGRHLYMNVVPGTDNVVVARAPRPPPPPPAVQEEEEDTRDHAVHNYMNLETDEVEGLPQRRAAPPLQLPTSPKSLNYIVLDLEPGVDPPRSPTNSIPPDSPRKPTESYATIDFKKTVALSHSVNPKFDNDSEGSRKTRHNSNIGELIAATRHSSSVSD